MAHEKRENSRVEEPHVKDVTEGTSIVAWHGNGDSAIKTDCAKLNTERYDRPHHGDQWPGGFFMEVGVRHFPPFLPLLLHTA